MDRMTADPCPAVTEAYALGALEAGEARAFEAHLSSGCAACRADVEAHRAVLARVDADAGCEPSPEVREQVLDLAQAPALPLDLESYAWDVVAPGVRLHVMREDPARGVRGCLVWADGGARHPTHRHLGVENILVLQGALRDERGTYGPGEVCRSASGSVHAEEAVAGQDCVCYVVYYGELEAL
jgi:anti-sigma factor ChrR (cupin superfamily)